MQQHAMQMQQAALLDVQRGAPRPPPAGAAAAGSAVSTAVVDGVVYVNNEAVAHAPHGAVNLQAIWPQGAAHAVHQGERVFGPQRLPE